MANRGAGGVRAKIAGHTARHPTATDSRVAQRLKSIRLARNLSLERLAESVNVTWQQLQKYEQGVNRITASRLHDLACALNVDVTDFFEATLGAPPLSSKAAERHRLLQCFDALECEAARRLIVDFAAVLAQSPLARLSPEEAHPSSSSN